MASPMKATKGCTLTKIPHCSLYIPNGGTIEFYAMPTITDTKGAKYDPTPIIGRATPILTYAYSEARQISLDIPFIAMRKPDFAKNAQYLRWIASAVYPREPGQGCPYMPPPVCVIKFGSFLWRDANSGICVVLDKYNVKNDPAVPSDPDTLVPVKFTVSTQWQVVYDNHSLPNQNIIVMDGK